MFFRDAKGNGNTATLNKMDKDFISQKTQNNPYFYKLIIFKTTKIL